MLVYRVEDADGNGPYVLSTWPGQDALCAAHLGRPAPALPAGYVSACTSLAALQAWFGDWLPLLAQHGFSVRTHDVPAEWISSRGQLTAGEISFLPESER
jgi:hypothetical protein